MKRSGVRKGTTSEGAVRKRNINLGEKLVGREANGVAENPRRSAKTSLEHASNLTALRLGDGVR